MKKSFEDLTKQKFNYLTVISFNRRENNRTYWNCLCNCGKKVIIRADALKSGTIKSCGCYNKNFFRENCRILGINRKTHNKTHTRIYKIYHNMKDRCYRLKNKAYKNYGGRGIIICDEWLSDFMNFYNWAMANGYQENLTIDRINNNGNYEPSNCRWVTKKEQSRNRRNIHYINYNGQKYTIFELSEKYNIPYKKLYKRLITYKWDIEKTLFTP